MDVDSLLLYEPNDFSNFLCLLGFWPGSDLKAFLGGSLGLKLDSGGKGSGAL